MVIFYTIDHVIMGLLKLISRMRNPQLIHSVTKAPRLRHKNNINNISILGTFWVIKMTEKSLEKKYYDHNKNAISLKLNQDVWDIFIGECLPVPVTDTRKALFYICTLFFFFLMKQTRGKNVTSHPAGFL